MSAYYVRGWHRGDKTLWHGSKNAVYGDLDELIRIDEAMIAAGMYHITVDKFPTFIPHGDTWIPTGDYKLGIVDPDTDKPIQFNRTVGNRYEPMQNARLAKLLEGLNKHWPIEGTMMLKRGEITVVQLKIDEYTPGDCENEKHLAYLVVAIDYTKGGIMWLRTDVRVVCWNTYSMSLNALDKLRIPNSAKADDTLAFLTKVQEITVEAQKNHVRQMNDLFKREVTPEEAATIVDAAFPDAKKSSRMKIAELDAAQQVGGQLADDFFKLVDEDTSRFAWAQSRNDKLRAAVGNEMANFNKKHPYAAQTAYGTFQAVTNVMNHSPMFTGSDDKKAISVILGNKKKDQENAFNAALALIGEGKKKSEKK